MKKQETITLLDAKDRCTPNRQQLFCFYSKIKSFLYSVVCIIVFSVFSAECMAIDDRPEVRVGIFDFDGFYGTNELGDSCGYGYDYLNEISKYTNIRFIPVYASWNDCLTMLENGEIDLLDSAQKTEERLEKFLFSDYSTGLSYGQLYTRADNSALNFNDYDAFNGMTVGLLKGNSRSDGFRKYAQKNNFTFKEKEYASTDELIEALENREVDAVVTSSLRLVENEKPIAQFDPAPFYMIFNKNNPQLAAEINSALEQIHIDKPTLNNTLYQRYYANDSLGLTLTRKETDYLESAPVLRVSYDSFWAPFESYDDATGEPHGINVDILKLIAQKSGLRFEFVNGHSYESGMQAVADKTIDMHLSYDTNYSQASVRNVILSDTFLETPIAVVGREKTIHPDAVFALPEMYVPHQEYVKKNYPQSEIVIYEDVEECYSAILERSADFTLENLYVVNDQIATQHPSLEITFVTPLKDKFSFVFRSDIDPILINIISKSISAISDEERNTLILNHTTGTMGDFSFGAILEKYRSEFILIAAILALSIIITLIYIILTQKKNKRALIKMAYVDPITGISTYLKFKKDAQELLDANSDGHIFVLIKLDVKNFNMINEAYGFAKGNEVLCAIAQYLTGACTGNSDRCARIHADEFVMLKTYKSKEEYHEQEEIGLQQLKSMIRTLTGLSLRFSAGRYCAEHNDTTIEALYEQANYAHSLARKSDSEKEFLDFDETMRRVALQRQKIEGKMEEALSTGQFHVFLQPKYSLQNERPSGAEALVRWIESDGTMIYPDTFIPVFERNGFILQVDFYVFENVCSLLARWMQEGKPLVPISVNFSRLHLNVTDFVKRLVAIADKYAVPHKYLEVEVTESAILDNEDGFQAVLDELHEAGFTLSMDDFGSGYSSLGLLKNLAVDTIKLDKNFFLNSKHEWREQAVISSIVDMARKLGISTVAEGVEESKHVVFLRSIGCNCVQGFYYARPMPIKDFDTQAPQS